MLPNNNYNNNNNTGNAENTESQVTASNKEIEDLRHNLLKAVQCPVTFQIFRHPAVLLGSGGKVTGEIVEQEVAHQLINTTKKGLDREPITGHQRIFHLNALIESYMKANPTAERYPDYTAYPDYPTAKNRKMPSTATARPGYPPTTAIYARQNSQVFLAPPATTGHSANTRQIFLPQVVVIKPNNNKNTMKVLLIGAPNTGRRDLLLAARLNSTSDLRDIRIGIDFITIDHEGTQFQCWQNPNLPHLSGIDFIYFRDVDAIILMSNSTTNIPSLLTKVQENLQSRFNYYGIQYSEENLVTLIPVTNQAAPNAPPSTTSFTEHVIGRTRMVDFERDRDNLRTLFLSLLSNVKRLSSEASDTLDQQDQQENRESLRERGCTIS